MSGTEHTPNDCGDYTPEGDPGPVGETDDNPVTQSDFMKLCRETWLQKQAVDTIKDRLAEENKKLTGLQMDVVKIMHASDLEKQHMPGFGTLSIRKKHSVKVPKDQAAKDLLFTYIEKGKGPEVLAGLLTIPSNTLNSFWKEEYELAVARGDLEWNMPGLAEPEMYERLAMTKGK